MKQYRTTKTWWDEFGYIFKPQEVECVEALFEYDEYYYHIKDQYYNSTEIFPDKLIEAGADWIEEVKEERWRAEKGGDYWHVDVGGTGTGEAFACSSFEWLVPIDHQRHAFGNYFRTREEAQKAADEINSIFKRIRNESN